MIILMLKNYHAFVQNMSVVHENVYLKIDMIKKTYSYSYQRNFYFLNGTLNLESILVYEVTKDKKCFYKSWVTMKSLLHIFVFGCIMFL